MKSLERRNQIMDLLTNSNNPIKGSELAKIYGVTRQIIVKDIAILRAAGKNIIATPDGYLYNKDSNKVRAVITVNHNADRTIEELKIVIKYGGIIEDVTINHPIYGKIKGDLMIKNLNNLNEFENNFNNIKPLSNLTNGIHFHTILANSKEDMDKIKNELIEKSFLI